MNTLSMPQQKTFQKIYPLSLFVRSVSQQFTGCLYVASETINWSIFLEQGKLIFATNSDRPMARLERHLQELSQQIPSLTKTIQTQIQYQFALDGAEQLPNSDFHAIRWLLEHKYLDQTQAAMLIEELAREVIEPFLSISEGNYEFIQQNGIDGYQGLCHIELRPLVESCQMQLRRKSSAIKAAVPSLSSPTAAPQAAIAQPESTVVSATSHQSPETGSPPEKASYTVACIDDSSTILEAINSFLEEAHFSVVMINDPIKALMQIIRTKPDVVLMDIGMPNLDGYELCSLLRRHSSFKDIPIIMVTGNTGFIDRAKAKLVGASGYLTKPFTRSELLKMVFKHLN
jgi:twitching motility two-component system response regulator PilG